MSTVDASVAHDAHDSSHPSPRKYIAVAIWLAVATALEVGLFYMDTLPDWSIVGLLMFFMAVKFFLVIMWFMHLRFDSKLLKRLFVTGIALALSVYVIVLVTFGVFVGG